MEREQWAQFWQQHDFVLSPLFLSVSSVVRSFQICIYCKPIFHILDSLRRRHINAPYLDHILTAPKMQNENTFTYVAEFGTIQPQIVMCDMWFYIYLQVNLWIEWLWLATDNLPGTLDIIRRWDFNRVVRKGLAVSIPRCMELVPLCYIKSATTLTVLSLLLSSWVRLESHMQFCHSFWCSFSSQEWFENEGNISDSTGLYFSSLLDPFLALAHKTACVLPAWLCSSTQGLHALGYYFIMGPYVCQCKQGLKGAPAATVMGLCYGDPKAGTVFGCPLAVTLMVLCVCPC